MRRTSPPSNSHAHDHEWMVVEHESGLVYEDGAVIVEEECRYVEQKCVGTSERLDETFYETMYECDAARYHRFELTGVEEYVDDCSNVTERLATGSEAVRELYDDYPRLVEDAELRAAERLVDDGEFFDHVSIRGGLSGQSFDIDVVLDDATYCLHYEWVDSGRI